jgi:hypothetical protein
MKTVIGQDTIQPLFQAWITALALMRPARTATAGHDLVLYETRVFIEDGGETGSQRPSPLWSIRCGRWTSCMTRSGGRCIRLFNIVGDFNREELEMETDFPLPSERVIPSLERIMEWRDRCRCDVAPIPWLMKSILPVRSCQRQSHAILSNRYTCINTGRCPTRSGDGSSDSAIFIV